MLNSPFGNQPFDLPRGTLALVVVSSLQRVEVPIYVCVLYLWSVWLRGLFFCEIKGLRRLVGVLVRFGLGVGLRC